MPDQTPDFTSPIAGRIEVRQPCPWCGDRQMIPRHQFDEHVMRLHPDVKTVERRAAGTLPPATDQTERRDRYAALFRSAPGAERLGDATPGEIADAVMAVADAELQAERERLFAPLHRAEADNAELRARVAELEQAAASAVGRPDLRDLIAEALEREDTLNCGYDHSFVSTYGVDPETDGFVDAVVAALPADQRTATLREAADALKARHCSPESVQLVQQLIDARLCDECDGYGQTSTSTETGGTIRRCRKCNGRGLRRVAGEEPHTAGTPPEDPARIDRLRPEFTEHSSIESIDTQLRRARSQERRWHIRTEWLIGLRQRRTEQQARGEWPAASAVPAAPDTEA